MWYIQPLSFDFSVTFSWKVVFTMSNSSSISWILSFVLDLTTPFYMKEPNASWTHSITLWYSVSSASLIEKYMFSNNIPQLPIITSKEKKTTLTKHWYRLWFMPTWSVAWVHSRLKLYLHIDFILFPIFGHSSITFSWSSICIMYQFSTLFHSLPPSQTPFPLGNKCDKEGNKKNSFTWYWKSEVGHPYHIKQCTRLYTMENWHP